VREGRSDGCDTGGIFLGVTGQVLPRRYACCQEHKCIEQVRLKLECQIPMRKKYFWHRSILINHVAFIRILVCTKHISIQKSKTLISLYHYIIIFIKGTIMYNSLLKTNIILNLKLIYHKTL